jgi:hypothetical protein
LAAHQAIAAPGFNNGLGYGSGGVQGFNGFNGFAQQQQGFPGFQMPNGFGAGVPNFGGFPGPNFGQGQGQGQGQTGQGSSFQLSGSSSGTGPTQAQLQQAMQQMQNLFGQLEQSGWFKQLEGLAGTASSNLASGFIKRITDQIKQAMAKGGVGEQFTQTLGGAIDKASSSLAQGPSGAQTNGLPNVSNLAGSVSNLAGGLTSNLGGLSNIAQGLTSNLGGLTNMGQDVAKSFTSMSQAGSFNPPSMAGRARSLEANGDIDVKTRGLAKKED